MQLVKEFIKNNYGSVPKASAATGKDTTTYYRWRDMGATVRNGCVYLWHDNAITMMEGQPVKTGAWVYTASFFGSKK